MFVYLNGEFVKQEEALISPFDHGFLYGLGVFETVRVYDHHPFLLHDHIERLNCSLQQLNIQKQMCNEEVFHAIQELLWLNDLKDAYVRMNVSAGKGMLGLTVEPYLHPTVIIFMKELHIPENQTKEGVILSTPRNSPEGEERLKSHHYLNNILAKREIGSNPQLEGIFLTKEGYIAEGIVSNIFWVKEGVVYTPSPKTGILNGITRQYVIQLLHEMEIPIHEGFFRKEELLSSEEVFITNSLQEIVPITNIQTTEFSGSLGKITTKLQKMYRRHRTYLFSRHQLASR